MNTVSELLYKKWINQQLGHFYILKANGDQFTKKQKLQLWMNQFLGKILQKSLGLSSIEKGYSLLEKGHPDILMINQRSEDSCSKTVEKDYLLQDFKEFFQFINLRPFYLRHRFIVVEDTHLIGEQLGNRLLKSLEDPSLPHSSDAITIFFLHWQSRPLMPTLQGRAMTLNVDFTSSTHSNSSMTFSKPYFPTHDFSLWARHWQKNYLHKQSQSSNNSEENDKESIDQLLPQMIQFLENIQKNPSDIEDLVSLLRYSSRGQNLLFELLIEWECQHLSPYETKEKTLQAIKWFQESKKFHNSAAERILYLVNSTFCTQNTIRSGHNIN